MGAAILRQKLNAYLNSDSDFKAVYDYTRTRFEAAKDLSAHNWEHAYRDTINAIVIGEAESADMSIVLPATVMHDIGFLYGATGRTHGVIGADKLSEYLLKGAIKLSPAKLEQIAACIRTHKGSAHDEAPETLEAKVVSDADMLDKFGPIGIYQITRVFTEFNAGIDQTIHALGNAKRSFQTPTGGRLAEPLRPFSDQFVQALIEAREQYREDQS